VTLEVDMNGAEVYVDGDLEGQAPLPGSIYLSPGSHEIEARKDGKTASTQVSASAGQSSSLKLRMAAGSKQPAATSSAGGSAPATSDEPATEEAEVARERVGFGRWLVNTPTAMIGAGLAGVGLIGGAAFALGSKASYDAADSVAAGIERNAVEVDKKDNGPTGACIGIDTWLRDHGDPTIYGPQNPSGMAAAEAARAKRVPEYEDNCSKYQDNVKSGDTFKKLAIVGFAVGGAAAIGTIIYYAVDGKVDSSAKGKGQRRVVFVPLYEPGYAGALVSGSF
jgi:hypothetical protein